MKPTGLTEPQWKLLQDVVSRKTLRVSDRYKPAQRLSSMGIINAEPIEYSRLYLTPTDLGLAIVSAAKATAGGGE